MFVPICAYPHFLMSNETLRSHKTMRNGISIVQRVRPHYTIMVLGIIFLLIIIYSMFLPQTPILYDSSLPSSFSHILGTDLLGQDIFSQIILALRYSILLSGFTTISTCILGIILSVCAVSIRRVDGVVQLMSNLLIAFPPFVICLLLISRWGGSTKILMFGEFIAFLPVFIRLSYKELSLVMQQEYTQIAIGLGNSVSKICYTYGLPVLLPKLKAQIISLFSVSIGIESGFSYLGIGPPLPHTSLGTLLYDSIRYWHINPLYPLSIMITFFLLMNCIFITVKR